MVAAAVILPLLCAIAILAVGASAGCCVHQRRKRRLQALEAVSRRELVESLLAERESEQRLRQEEEAIIQANEQALQQTLEEIEQLQRQRQVVPANSFSNSLVISDEVIGQGAFGNMCRSGRMFAPTKIWRKWHKKVNIGQKRYAVASALAASAVPALVMARGHVVDDVPEVPLVLDTSIESTKMSMACDQSTNLTIELRASPPSIFPLPSCSFMNADRGSRRDFVSAAFACSLGH